MPNFGGVFSLHRRMLKSSPLFPPGIRHTFFRRNILRNSFLFLHPRRFPHHLSLQPSCIVPHMGQSDRNYHTEYSPEKYIHVSPYFLPKVDIVLIIIYTNNLKFALATLDKAHASINQFRQQHWQLLLWQRRRRGAVFLASFRFLPSTVAGPLPYYLQ